MSDVKVTDSVLYVGCDDLDIDLFESQYHVPNGVSYNSYVILDEKIAIMDTVDPRRTEEWLEKVEKALGFPPSTLSCCGSSPSWTPRTRAAPCWPSSTKSIRAPIPATGSWARPRPSAAWPLLTS